MKTKLTALALLFVVVFSACQQHAQPKLDSKEDILSRIKAPDFPKDTFTITDFGAVGDSVTDCKPAIDQAIQACTTAGGGTVLVPAGIWFVDGPIHS